MNRKWTIEMCQEEAFKYKTRKEFELNSKSAYYAAMRHNWLNAVCLHMNRVGNRMFRCIYVYEFSDNHAYVGISYDINKRNESRKKQLNDAVTKYINETKLVPTIKKLCEYIHVNVAAELENDCIEMYKTMGWSMLNKQKGGAIGMSKKYWSFEHCKKIAINFTSRSEFYNKNNKAYTAAQRNGWLNDICQHMISKIHHWNLTEINRLALQYKSRYEFQKNNKNAYIWAVRHSKLDIVCSHMIK